MAKELHRGIVNLKNMILEMGRFASGMLADSIKALYNNDMELAKSIDSRKKRLAAYDDEIEQAAFKLIGLFQPMAIDLRRIACILRMNTSLHRIGRYGKDIAVIVDRYTSDQPNKISLVNLQHMWEHVRDMIADALESFDRADVKRFEDFKERDDEVDQLRWSIFRECLTYMMENPSCITECSSYIMIARYLERCGDHACSMAEKIYFMVTGKHKEIS